MNQQENNEIKLNSKKKKGTRPVVFMVVCSVLFMVIVTLGTLFYYSYVVRKSEELLTKSASSGYQGRYVMICDNSEMWSEVYENSKEFANNKSIFVDLISERLSIDYTKEDLLRIAIESGADGILVEAENTDTFRRLISEADQKKIPVVTLMNDCQDSKRISLVQPGAYNLGKLYGEQFLREKRPTDKNIIVVMDASSKDSIQNIIYSGIQDTLSAAGYSDISLNPLSIDSSDPFATEEEIRRSFISDDSMSEVIICLDEISTEGFYQALIDYNKVGDIRLIGYYNSKRILKGIQQGVIEATVTINTEELAKCGIDALNEYREFGYVSDYYSVDSQLINKDNIGEYIID